MEKIARNNPFLWLGLLLLAWMLLGVQFAQPKTVSGPFFEATEHHLGVTRWKAAPRLGLDAWTTKITSGDSVVPKGEFSKVAPATAKQLQKKFKHAENFGVSGNYSPANAKRFNQAIQEHLNAPGTKEISGTYHGSPVTSHTDPNSGLTVIQNPNGSFLSGWKLNPQQLQHVLKDGKL